MVSIIIIAVAAGFVGGTKYRDWQRKKRRGFKLGQQLRDNEHFRNMWNAMKK